MTVHPPPYTKTDQQEQDRGKTVRGQRDLDEAGEGGQEGRKGRTTVTPLIMFSINDRIVRRHARCFRPPCQTERVMVLAPFFWYCETPNPSPARNATPHRPSRPNPTRSSTDNQQRTANNKRCVSQTDSLLHRRAPQSEGNPTHKLDVHVDVSDVLGELSSGSLNVDDPRLEVNGDTRGNNELFGLEDVLHLRKAMSIGAGKGFGGRRGDDEGQKDRTEHSRTRE